MDVDAILGFLSPARNAAGQASLDVDRNLCLGPPERKHLSGGACVAALIDEVEHVTGKPLIQASAQFQRAPAFGETASIVIDHHKPGRSIDLLEASLRVGDRASVSLQASLGERRSVGEFVWAKPPCVDPPYDCGPIPFVRADEGDLHTHLDMRLAAEPSDGALVFWAKSPTSSKASIPGFLALLADYLPESIHFNIGRPAGAVSLDNVIRIVEANLTSWTLCAVQLAAVQNGLFHGQMQIFNERARLMATASQSGVVRTIE